MGPTAVATHTWKITVHPLHGLRFDRHRKKWEFYQMFDTNAVPIRLNQWLRQRLFCVDGRQYSLWDTLKFLVNKEAAHVDTKKKNHRNLDRTLLIRNDKTSEGFSGCRVILRSAPGRAMVFSSDIFHYGYTGFKS